MIVRYRGEHDRQVLVEVDGHGEGRRRYYVYRLIGVPPEPGPLEQFHFYLDAVKAGIRAAERWLAKPAH